MLNRFCTVLALAALALLHPAARMQGCPSKALNLIVPFPLVAEMIKGDIARAAGACVCERAS